MTDRILGDLQYREFREQIDNHYAAAYQVRLDLEDQPVHHIHAWHMHESEWKKAALTMLAESLRRQ